MKKLSMSAKIRRYMEKHDNAKPKEIADALGCPVSRVYAITYRIKKGLNTQDKPKRAYVRKVRAETKLWHPPMALPMPEPEPDPVNHPSHYKIGGIETIDFIEAKGLGYHLGNVVKYITRAGHKGTSNGMEDLQKARWYLDRAIEKNEVASPTR